LLLNRWSQAVIVKEDVLQCLSLHLVLDEGVPMKKSSHFPALVLAGLILGSGALKAQAGQIPLPTTLDQLLPAGNYALVSSPTETDTFSNFAYTTSPIGTPPAASGINVLEYHAGQEAGLTFNGAFTAPAPPPGGTGPTLDYSIFYTVTAPVGSLMTDAILSGGFSTFGGTGSGSVLETITNALTGVSIGTMEIASPPGAGSATLEFAGVQSIRIEKDFSLVPGTQGVSISIIDQGFSSTGVPEPNSIVLLGIAMTGLFAFRRFGKKAAQGE
jgi:hypothetical protein